MKRQLKKLMKMAELYGKGERMMEIYQPFIGKT